MTLGIMLIDVSGLHARAVIRLACW